MKNSFNYSKMTPNYNQQIHVKEAFFSDFSMVIVISGRIYLPPCKHSFHIPFLNEKKIDMPLIKSAYSIFAGWGAPSVTSPHPKSMHGFCLKKSKNQRRGSSSYKL